MCKRFSTLEFSGQIIHTKITFNRIMKEQFPASDNS